MTSAIHADALLDPGTGETVRNAVLVSEDGRIVASGSRDQVRVPAGATVVDASGLTLLPGLIDSHVHLCTRGDGLDLGESLGTPPSLALLAAVPSCRATLEAGFTTVRDAGLTPVGVRMAVERGYFPGPRMLLAITVLSETGGHTDPMFACGACVPFGASSMVPDSVVDGVEPMRHRVREVIRAGADWIKLCTSGGVLSAGDSPHHTTLTLDEIGAAVAEAATQGRKVMAHAQANQGIKNALIAGVSTIEHGIWLDGDAVEMMLKGNRALVPTLVAPLWVIRHAQAGRMPGWAAEKGRAVAEDHRRSVRMAIEAGVKIAYGTDSGVGPHGSNGEELLVLNELGLSPLDCIRSATLVAAEVIGLEGRVGTLAPGAWADLIGVAGDPLTDLSLLARPENVELVVKGGVAFKERA